MAGQVIIEVVDKSLRGKRWVFEEHDAFVFGRSSDCHIQIPPQDATASRHHFILEVNPPDVAIRDLGSRNGTWVNGVKHGGREKSATPEQAAQHSFPEVTLRHGDKIQVGKTILMVSVELPAVCCQCNQDIPDEQRQYCAWIGGTFVCATCKDKLIAPANPPKKSEPIRCRRCGEDVTDEVGKACRRAYICKACRKQADGAPLKAKGHKHNAVKRDAQTHSMVDDYAIEKQLGVGGFGAVYLAKHRKTGKRVAIKVMLSKVAVEEDAQEKFVREIESLKKLQHSNIVTLLDFSAADGAFYFVMEYCEGGSVGDLMAKSGGKLPLSKAGPIVLQALTGLAHAHRNGFVHRDLKPQNLLLHRASESWTAKIGDLGLAKNFEHAGFSGMTLTGQYCGTPHFMPREQVLQYRNVKPTCDVWSMAATFYNMLTGRTPRDFPRGRDPIEVILRDAIIPIRQRDRTIPKPLAEVIDRALLNFPIDRHQDASVMLEVLAKAL